MTVIDIQEWIKLKAGEVHMYILKHGIPSTDAVEIVHPRLSRDSQLQIMKVLQRLSAKGRVDELVALVKSLNKQ